MNSTLQSWAQVLTIAAAIVGALIYQTHYVDKRFDALDKRFDDFKEWIRAELRRIDERLDRIEHPLIKQ